MRILWQASGLALARRIARPRTSRRFSSERQWSTPLAKTIANAIHTTGPISIAAYMRQCLTAAHGGYYARQLGGHDQFGRKGDFVTSPEISQTFGELVAIWIVAEWMAQGSKSSGVELIELGPGRGTLMDDVLRSIRNFRPLANALESVYLVESDSGLRERQQKLLCGDATMQYSDTGYQSTVKHLGVGVNWLESFKLLPKVSDKTSFIIAHEFFDALPIHAFQSVAPSPLRAPELQGLSGPIKVKPSHHARTPQWRELLVDNVIPEPERLRSPTGPGSDMPTSRPEFQLSLAKASTPASLTIPESSPRYRALKSQPTSTIEISPESQAIASALAARIGPRDAPPSGAALIVDYGPAETVPTSTLRGIRRHARVSPLERPGETDLSADVDFTALAEAALGGSDGVEVHGPVEQGAWLSAMGARERMDALVRRAQETGHSEGAERVRKGVERLMERGGGGMGKLYKVMAIVPENDGKRRPAGFESTTDV